MKKIKRFTMFTIAVLVAGGINIVGTKSVQAIENQPIDTSATAGLIMDGNKFLQINSIGQDNQPAQTAKPTQETQISEDNKIPDKPQITGDDIVEYAKQFIGVPYRAGGNTTAGFDCSGYTKYVFKHFNVDLSRIAADQTSMGNVISKSDLQPGDLVFFGKSIYHVGIYVGNGQFIHSPKPGERVKIMDMKYMPDYNTARRITLPQ